MSLPATGRLQWDDVPAPLRDLLAQQLGGPPADVHTPAGGFGHQLAAALTLESGRRVFVKAAADEDSLTAANRHEAAVLEALPPGAPAPELLGIHRAGGWTAVLITHLEGPHPHLSPGSEDPGQIWALLDKLASTPAPAAYTAATTGTAPPAITRLHGWTTLAADPPQDLPAVAYAHLSQLAELEAAWPALAHGDRIVHADLRADNMVRDRSRGVTFVDWAHAITGPACLDAVSLAPQLILAGHDVAGVAAVLHEHPTASSAPQTATAFLTALTGHWHRNARRPAPPGAPGLRTYQHRAAAAGLALLGHRLHWSTR
jgi:aminoglycoside phosphotransferase (APT) family kinase protein